ncbi:MAG TPA: SDR family NAD(P)-dependent oxidoreductase [Rhizobiales bacterium]|nr:SDR family NAD(P)-dependent oxidoreductase [Hyphomicrobiales bacterium]
MDKPLEGKVAVVTGASRGIGYALAKALAAKGAHIIAVARTTGGLEELDDEIQALGSTATLVPLDLNDFAGIDRLGGAIYERWGKLDIVIGNAGMLGVLSPLGHIDPKLWDKVMAINVTANWRLIRSLDLLLRQAEAGRALFVTSGAADKCTAYWGVYTVSKAALNALVRTYAAENATTPVCANLINPGPIATRLRAKAMPGEDPSTLPTPDDLAKAVVPLCLPGEMANGVIFDFVDGAMKQRKS